VNDVWGWTDPDTRREYAVVGRSEGTSFVDVTDPTRPIFLGPDDRYQGREICFAYGESAVSIGDVTDKEAPVILGNANHPNTAYIHQGWLTEDQRYIFVNDELDEMNGLTDRTRTLIWDVSDLEDPVFAGEYLGETSATDHNLYIAGDIMYQSNYAAGLRVIDISDPLNGREVGFFDTAPFAPPVPGFFDGSWSNYPFFPSGNILVTSHKQGLFILRRRMPIM